MGPSRVDRRGLVDEEVVAAETGVALATLRVEDPERRPPPRRTRMVAGDHHLRPLADDVPAEPDPRPPGELETEPGRLGDGRGQPARGPLQAGGLQHDEEGLRPPGKGRQPAEPISDARHPRGPGQPAARQVQDQHVHRPAGQQRTGDGQPLVEVVRGDDHEPVEPDPPGDRLDRIEAPGQVQPGDDAALGLGLRGQPMDEGGPAARAISADRHAGRPRQTASAKDGIKGREPGPDDSLVGIRPMLRGRDGSARLRADGEERRGQRQRAIGVRDHPRSCRAPASLEARHGRRHVRGEGRHRTSNIEHPFE